MKDIESTCEICFDEIYLEAQIEREILWQQLLLSAAIRMTERNLRTPLLKRNRQKRQKGWLA